MNPTIQKLLDYGTDYGLKIIGALLIFIIGRWIALFVARTVRKLMERHKVDPVLISFIHSLVTATLMILVILAAISKLGVQTTSFIAILGAAGLAVGLALQGSLANFASGVLIILFRPFKIGDYIEGGGTAGIVEEIGILFTVMRTPDNRRIVSPNAALMSGHITNVTANPTRRLDLVFGVSYTDDLDKVKAVLEEIIAADSRVLPEPAPQIVVGALADSSVNFFVRPWVKKEDYWGLFFDLTKTVKQRFDKEGISIPFPQRDVHLFQEAPPAAG